MTTATDSTSRQSRTPKEVDETDLLVADPPFDDGSGLEGVPEEDLEPTEKVNLRIPRRLLLAARQSATPLDAGTVQEICQGLLEAALRKRASEARERALASINRTIGDLGEPIADVPPARNKDPKHLTVYLSLYALEIAQDLARRKGTTLTVQKICEPLLSAELKKHRTAAVETARAIIKALETPDDEQDGAP